MPKYKKISSVLTRSAYLFETRYGHCKKYYAKTRMGDGVDVADPKAARFCAYGMIAKVQNLPPGEEMGCETSKFFRDFYFLLKGDPSFIIDWNDDPLRTKEEVIEMLRMAAKAAKEQKL